MKIEHAAYQVEDPAAMAQWYVAHLGLTLVRAQDAPPFGQFLADDGGAVMLELYRHPLLSVPDYRSMDPLTLHIAFVADDVAAVRTRLIAAGATPEGESATNAGGDHLAMLRDPWGLAIQFVRRKVAMIG
jgi:catechol 2,3-dioxygenase-like lactoylglutathione lyase family enzyme